MAASAQRIAPWESFERGGAALLVSSCQKQPQTQLQRRIRSSNLVGAVARKVCEQDAYRQYRVKHQQPRTWGMARVLW